MSELLAAASVYATVGPDHELWCATEGVPPFLAGKTVPALVARMGFLASKPLVRLVGSARNAGLISRLWDFQRDDLLSIELATPALVGLGVVSPKMALVRASRNGHGLSPSAGGWHALRADEVAFYRGAAALEEGQEDLVIEAMRGHPVFRQLQFIEGHDVPSLAWALAEIRDPRWYIDPERPDRVGRLYSYFGVDKAVTGRPADSTITRRRLAASGAWKAHDVSPDIARFPGGFLMRLYVTLSKGERAASRSATRCFLRFVQAVWLNEIYRGETGDPLFVPEHFFQRALGPEAPHATVAQAYREHCKRLVVGPEGGR